ncbi:MAG: MBL fold metallo-hydrolase [Clostridia bacterium]|nr:MBL fold metallo-hydrolase [Clostridia bacterium]
MTLIEGDDAALLIDTGYGTEDIGELLQELIGNKPVRAFLTHHHHDHALGVRTLDCMKKCEYSMFAEDAPAWSMYTGIEKRKTVLQQAIGKGMQVDPDTFLAGAIAAPAAAVPGDVDLGGLTARMIACPGHTPGSACVLIVERRLMLTGDNWNPCTWLFFPEALGVKAYRQNVQMLQAYDFTHVLCSHQLELFPRSRFDSFVNSLTDDVLRAARPVSIGGWEHTDTRQADVADGQILVFDWAKAQL